MHLSPRFRDVVFPPAVRRAPVVSLVRPRPAPPPPQEPRAHLSVAQSAFVRWLFGQAGLDVAAYRAETLIRRLPACLRPGGVVVLGRAERPVAEQLWPVGPWMFRRVRAWP